MKKDGRFWILIGALAIVGGLFLAFLWSVMRAPGQPAMVQPTANVTETTNGAADAAPAGDKPADPFAQPGDAGITETNPLAPPPDTERMIREAQEASERAQAQAAEAQARIRAEANRALERARQQTERARQRARPQPAGDKPEDDGKPPEDW